MICSRRVLHKFLHQVSTPYDLSLPLTRYVVNVVVWIVGNENEFQYELSVVILHIMSNISPTFQLFIALIGRVRDVHFSCRILLKQI